MAGKKKDLRRVVAQNLCRHFNGTNLGGCARAGLACLEAHHTGVITAGDSLGCGIALDRCRQPAEPDVNRWDYVFTFRSVDEAIAVEVHPANANDVDEMIAKKRWAEALLAQQCPTLRVVGWVWVAPPPSGEINILRQGPAALRLAEARISFPTKTCRLP